MAKKLITLRIHRAKNKELYFTINGGNGKVIMTSETYKRRQGVDRAIASILNGISDGEYQVIQDYAPDFISETKDSASNAGFDYQQIAEETKFSDKGQAHLSPVDRLRDRGLM
jgi:uncharacterized protein YegP (UPF0339 family)